MITLTQKQAGFFALSGTLDESLKTSDVSSTILAGCAGLTTLHLDLFGIRGGNSSGLLHFINLLRSVPLALNISRVPVWMVWQFNMLYDLLSQHLWISSFEAEYTNPATQVGRTFLLEVEHDIPLRDDYSDFKAPQKQHEGEVFVPDFDETYLDFMVFLNSVRRDRKG